MPYTDFHFTPTGTGVISGKEVLEQTEDAINDLGGQISGDVQTAIDTANNALNTANTASADAQNAVNTVNTAYTAATNAQNTANAAQNTASNALTAAQNAQNDVNALGNRVTTAEGNITQNTNAITGLTTRMGTAEGNITTLQNDVITAQATANSAQQTATTARQQAYVLRYSSTAITDNSTIAYSTLDNTDNIKAGDKIIDVDGKIFSIVSVDSDNSTVTIGTALIDLANDSDVVHKSGNETINGIKTFSNDIRISKTSPFFNVFSSGYIKGQAPASNAYSGVRFFDDINSGSANTITGGFEVEYNRDGYNKSYIASRNYAGENHKAFTVGLRVPNDDIRSIDFLPSANGIVNLGTSTNKWKSFNGLNPSSLGMPDLDNGIDISGFITGGNSHNEYTPTVDGWISVILKTKDGSCGVFLYQGGMANGHDSSTSLFNESEPCAMANLPVKAGTVVNIDSRYGKNNYVYSAKFYPCRGNV